MDKLPEHWELVQLGRIGFLFKGKGGTKEDEIFDGIPCVRYGDIYTQHQFFVRNSRACISQEYADNYSPIQYGDILFAGSGETIDEIGKSVVNLISGNAYCGGDIIVFRPSIIAHAPFLGYVTDCPQIAYQKSRMGRGITVMHIYSDALKYLNIALPPLSEQEAIVRYLDYVDGRISRYISARKKLVKLLEEQKHALIHRAVTRGLDPDVRLKSSGVEWLGDMPAHWEMRRLRSTVQIINGTTPASDNPKYWNGSIAWLTPEDLGQLTSRYIKGSARRITNEGYHACGTTLAPAGSIALSTRAPIGHIGILIVSACVNQGCRLLVPKKAIKSEYLYYELNVVRSELQSLGQGSTFTELSRVRLADFALNVPPLPEQEAITEYLDKATTDIDIAINRVRRQIELLSEYRTRLIADVVTGKLDVREAAGQLPDEIERLEEPE